MAGKGRKPFWDDRRERFSQLLAAGVKPAEAAKQVGWLGFRKDETRRTFPPKRGLVLEWTADHQPACCLVVASIHHERSRIPDITSVAVLDRSANTPLQLH